MTAMDQKVCAWGGPAGAACIGVGLLLAGFVPPPSATLEALEVASLYRENAGMIRLGMVIGLLGIAGYAMLVAAISTQMRRQQLPSQLPVYLQLGAGSIGVLTVMFPLMIFAVAAFRPERDPQLIQLLNDLGWLIIIPAFPTFIAQYLGIAFGIFQDRSPSPPFPRWLGYFNLWVMVLFMPGGAAYFFRTGPFAWDGILAFWLAASAFFAWLLVMCWQLLRAINAQESRER